MKNKTTGLTVCRFGKIEDFLRERTAVIFMKQAMKNIRKKFFFLGSLWVLFYTSFAMTGCGKLTFKEDHYLCEPGEPGACPAGWVCRTSETSETKRCFRSESVCGNNIREGDEECDGDDLNGETCDSLELGEGNLGCRADCTGFDASGCTNEPYCGNNIKEEGEECDGSDLAGETCQSQGFDTGVLGCRADCLGFDTSGCSAGSSITWITISGGTFDMGSNDGAPHEQPVHSVTVPTFEMTKTEVTVAQYEECVMEEECTTPSTGDRCNWDVPDYEDHPVNCITWDQAREFCEWAGGRLPSEAEWEYAARSEGQNITYPWGDETATCDYAVMEEFDDWGCGTSRTWQVCSKVAGNTDQGLCDMAGNVWEWVEDDWHGSYDCDTHSTVPGCEIGGKAPSDGSAWVNEPRGSERVMRGGSLIQKADGLLAAVRGHQDPSADYVQYYYGVRCAR